MYGFKIHKNSDVKQEIYLKMWRYEEKCITGYGTALLELIEFNGQTSYYVIVL